MYEKTGNRTAARFLIALLAVAMVFTMMPLTMGSAFAADAKDYQPALTVTGPDGTATVYQTREEAIEKIGTVDDESFGSAMKGIPVKKLLSGYADDAVVTVQTQDNYSGTLNANGKTVRELKDMKGLLAYQENGVDYDPVAGVDDKGKPHGGYFVFYVGKDASGKVLKDKWVNRITISNAGSGGGDQPDPKPAAPVLTVKGNDLANQLSYASIAELKNDAKDKNLNQKVTFHTLNAYGTEEDLTVTGIRIEDLITQVAGLKEGARITSLRVVADDGTSCFFTEDEITKEDLTGNKMMFIWKEGEDKDVQKIAIGQFAATDVNKSLWLKGDSLTLSVNESPVPGKASIKSVKAGKKKATITWKKVADADGYVISQATKKNGKYKAVKTINKGTTVKATITKLKKGKTYYFKVTAFKNGRSDQQMGAPSPAKSVKIKK